MWNTVWVDLLLSISKNLNIYKYDASDQCWYQSIFSLFRYLNQRKELIDLGMLEIATKLDPKLIEEYAWDFKENSVI